MLTSVRRFMPVLLVICAMNACSAENTPVTISVKDEGHICVVESHDRPCADLPVFLVNDLHLGRGVDLVVSPVACGEVAMARANVVGDQLRDAGFTRVTVVGFITEPNSKCAS